MLQDVRMMSSGKPPQHSAEVEADLEKAEGMIRFLFNDVQLLKDGRHLQAEQMYRRCKGNKRIKPEINILHLITDAEAAGVKCF